MIYEGQLTAPPAPVHTWKNAGRPQILIRSPGSLPFQLKSTLVPRSHAFVEWRWQLSVQLAMGLE